MRRADRHAVWWTVAVMVASLLAATVPAFDATGAPMAGCGTAAGPVSDGACGPRPAQGQPGCKTTGSCRYTGQLP